MIATPYGLARLRLADTFGAAAARNHHAKAFSEPMRQAHESEPRSPSHNVCMGELMRQDGGKTLTLIEKQNRRQPHAAQERDADRPRTARAIGSNEGVTRG